MEKGSLEKLLVNGEEIKVLATRGSIIDERYTEEARKIAGFMINNLGLSFGNVEFKILDNDEFAEKVTLYGNPLPSWEAGQEKLVQEDSMKYRQGVLYEMVGHRFYIPLNQKEEFTAVYINKNNTYDEVISVMAHVYGHLHMDYNNRLSRSIDANSNKHAHYRERYREMERVLGVKTVEKLYDYAQTLGGLIDLFPDFHSQNKKDYYATDNSFPQEDIYDVYRFTIDNLKLNGWEKELLEQMHDINQLMKGARIKIMHEGFATFVQDKYIEEVAKTDVGTAWKMRNFLLGIADVLSPAQMPYYLGFRLFKTIEKRWNEGRHGPVYNMLSDNEKRSYHTDEGRGLDEILNITKSYTDWEFIFSYADLDFFKDLAREIQEKRNIMIEQMYGSTYPDYIIKRIEAASNAGLDPDLLRFQLLLETENYGPTVYIPKGSFKGDKLYLRQDLSFITRYASAIKTEEEKEEFDSEVYQMFSLDNRYTVKSLHRISKLWGIPVILETMNSGGKPLTLTSDGGKLYRSEKGNGPKFSD